MMPTESDPVKVIEGDALKVSRTLPDGCVQCCVTSPPYFGLRDYGHPGQIGLEPSPAEYVARLVDVFREVRRVLRDDGTLWLNLGDSYSGSNQTGGTNSYSGVGISQPHCNKPKTVTGVKTKDLIGIPWRVAFALQADGWYLRQDIIWAKPNPMPESVTDRCTKAHEYLFLLAKSERYHYDADAIAEESIYPDDNRKARQKPEDRESMMGDAGQLRAVMNPNGAKTYPTRNRRSVWTVTPKPFKDAHFAVMPEALVEPCILAGCPEGGVILDPFLGSGTVAAVAVKNWRRAIGIELNPAYAAMARKRADGALRRDKGSMFAGV